MEDKKNENCIFCFSLLFSTMKIEYKEIPTITSNCYLNHQKQILLSHFLEYNNKSFDNIKLKVECPLCNEFLDKDNFFICIENNKLICPKCIALNIVISASSNKQKKIKTKMKGKTDNNKIKNEPHYATLISLLKESMPENKDINFFDEKIIEKEKNDLNIKFKEYKDIIMEEKHYKILLKLYNFLLDLNDLKKKIYNVYKENKGYLSKRFYENVENIISLNELFEIFLNNLTLNENEQSLIASKELKNDIRALLEYYKNRIDKSIFINKLIKEKKEIKCIYQQDSIISYILKFRYESISGEIENYLIISSNNGIITLLNIDDYKPVYNLDIFQSKGVYHLIQCKNEKNVFYASSWGCFKKIKLLKENNKDNEKKLFTHTVIKTYKKLDIIRILKLIELPKNILSKNKNNFNDIISLDEGGHIIIWGYNQDEKKDLKEEIFVAEREDSINNMILFESNKIQNKLIFTTRNSTLYGSIHFYNIEDNISEAKCMKNSYRRKTIYFDLQYNTLKQINDLMIVFPQNKKIVLINVKYYEIVTIVELQTELEKERFYNNYGETIDIINYENNNNNHIFILSSKRYIFEYLFEENNLIYLGKTKLDEIKEDIEFVLNSGNNNICIYLKLNKKILLINL